ncbi:hypothetical protein ACKWTF_015778 [Chironomus riparius]
MYGLNDTVSHAKKLLKNKLNTENELRKLFSDPRLINHKIVNFLFVGDDENDFLKSFINYFYDRFDSLKYKKKKRNVDWKNLKIEYSAINIWNDVFIHADESSGNYFGILLTNINRLQNKEAISGAEVLFKIGSLIPSTNVVNLNDKLSENNLYYFKKTLDFLLNYKNLSKFNKNGSEFIDQLTIENQSHEIFKYLNIIDKDGPTSKLEELEPQPSCSKSSNQIKNKKKYSTQSDDDYQASLSSPKKSRTSDSELDDDDEDKNAIDDTKECSIAHKMESKSKTFKFISPRCVKKYQAKALAKEIDSLTINTKTRNFETMLDVEQYLTALPTKTQENNCIFRLPEDIFIEAFKFLNDDDKLNLIFTSQGFVKIFQMSRAILKRFKIRVNKHNIDKLLRHPPLHRIPIISLSFDLEGIDSIQKYLILLNKFKGSIEHLEVKNAEFKNYNEFFEFFGNIPYFKTLYLERCKVENVKNEIFPQLPHLESIYFNKCDDNIFKILQNQQSISKITIRNDDWTWNGFPHNIFNKMAKNAQKLKKIVLIGSGTGSFFDTDDISFKVEVLDTTMITFHWYVGIRNGRTSFLKTQLGHLKELTIHQLPFDFDGGKVLKYIIEEMNLDKFYYGKIPLILDGQKQEVKEFEANEIQITSIYEMFKQFPSTPSFRFNLSSTDIASDEIERLINPQTSLFKGLENFEVVDSSKYRGTLGVFLGMFKNMRNLKSLSLKTEDRNINTLLEEFLPCMSKLEEIYLTSTAPRETERLNIIKSFVPLIRKLSVAPQFVEEAKMIFGSTVDVCSVFEV